MDNNHLSRRNLMLSGAGLTLAALASAQDTKPALTAAQVIDRIKSNVGVPWREQTVDKIIAGEAETAVKGIATTMMATLDVVQRAAAAGKNMVITHEPTFYSHEDTTDRLKDDPTYQFKPTSCARTVWSCSASTITGTPIDPMELPWGWRASWDGRRTPMRRNPRLFTFPATPLARFAKDMETRLKIRTMRVAGGSGRSRQECLEPRYKRNRYLSWR
jgi:hypothetical protein